MDVTFYICTAWVRLHTLMDKVLDGVFSQTYTNWHWTIIDNTENFELTEYFSKFFNEHPEYEIHKNKVNIIPLRYHNALNKNLAGVYKNIAIGLCPAFDEDFIMQLDYDDIFEPNALYEYNQCINNNKGVEFVYARFFKLWQYDCETNKLTFERVHNLPRPVFYIKDGGNWHSFCAPPLCYKKKQFIEILGGYNEDKRYPDDYSILAAKFKLRCKIVDGPVFNKIEFGKEYNDSLMYKYDDSKFNEMAYEYKHFLFENFGISFDKISEYDF